MRLIKKYNSKTILGGFCHVSSLGRYYMIRNILQEKISRLTSTSNLIGRYPTPMVGIHSCGE